MANQDGGAYVDGTLNPAYLDLTRDNALGCSTTIEGGDELPFEGSPTPKPGSAARFSRRNRSGEFARSRPISVARRPRRGDWRGAHRHAFDGSAPSPPPPLQSQVGRCSFPNLISRKAGLHFFAESASL
jgi:hypothetical protein